MCAFLVAEQVRAARFETIYMDDTIRLANDSRGKPKRDQVAKRLLLMLEFLVTAAATEASLAACHLLALLSTHTGS